MRIKVLASGSTGNSYRISDGKTSVLLDAGLPFSAIQKGCDFSLASLDGCLITHEHNDHAKAGADLMKRSVDVYTSQGTALIHGWSGHRLHIVKSMERVTIGTFDVLVFDVEHDSVEPLGFVVHSRETREKLLYFTDTFYVKYRFDGLTHILCECNYDRNMLLENVRIGEIEPFVAKRIMKSHMCIDTLLNMLQSNDLSKLRQIYLLHISERNGNVETFKERVQRLTGAEVYACY
jgi:phosphoribosyl 1,2-cyclic phosphodiesterase